MILADLDANGYAIVIAAFFMGLTGLFTSIAQLILGYRRERDRIIREQVVADRLEAAQKVTAKAVRRQRSEMHTLTTDQNRIIAKVADGVEKVSSDVETVRKSTNGMKDELVQATKEGAFAKGLLEGQAKAKTDATSDSAIRLMMDAAKASQTASPTETDIEQIHN